MFCKGYNKEMELWDCIKNQLSIFCLPHFPCHSCEGGVSISIPIPVAKNTVKNKIPKGMSKAVAKSMGII